MAGLGEKSLKEQEGCQQLWRKKRVGPGAGCLLGFEEGLLDLLYCSLTEGSQSRGPLTHLIGVYETSHICEFKMASKLKGLEGRSMEEKSYRFFFEDFQTFLSGMVVPE